MNTIPEQKLHAVVAGASGVVGSRVLQRLLECAEIGQVVAVGRKPLAEHHPKLVAKVADLQDSAAMASEIGGKVEIAVCCLGTTMKKAGSREGFRAVDLDAAVAFGKAALQQGAKRFLLVSSIGASAQSRNFYLRTKGEAEGALAKLGFAQVTILRPSFIDDQGARKEFRFAERIALPLSKAFFAIVGRTSRYAPITADTIAKAIVRLALDESTERVRVVESDRLQDVGR